MSRGALADGRDDVLLAEDMMTMWAVGYAVIGVVLIAVVEWQRWQWR